TSGGQRDKPKSSGEEEPSERAGAGASRSGKVACPTPPEEGWGILAERCVPGTVGGMLEELQTQTRQRTPNPERGFSLIEIAMVLVILGILIAIAIPYFGGE